MPKNFAETSFWVEATQETLRVSYAEGLLKMSKAGYHKFFRLCMFVVDLWLAIIG